MEITLVVGEEAKGIWEAAHASSFVRLREERGVVGLVADEEGAVDRGGVDGGSSILPACRGLLPNSSPRMARRDPNITAFRYCQSSIMQ